MTVANPAGAQALRISLLVFLASGFVLYPDPVWSLTFYLGVMPLTLYVLWTGRGFDWRQRNVILAGLLLAWSALSLLWGENPGGHRVVKFLWDTLCTGVFFVALQIACNSERRMTSNIGSTLIVAGAGNAVLSMILALHHHPLMLLVNPDWRLEGWAQTRHSILGALVMTSCYLFALHRSLHEWRYRGWYGLAAGLCLLFIALGDSRGALVAAAAGTLVLLFGLSGRAKTFVIAGVVLAGAALVATAILVDPELLSWLGQRLLDRGGSYRPEIWSFTLNRVAEAPILGHGLAAYLGLSARFTFPHSLYMSALFYTGAVGLALLVTMIASITLDAWRTPDVLDRDLLLSLWLAGLCGGLTDLGQIASAPSPLWYIFWLPFALCCGALWWARNPEKRSEVYRTAAHIRSSDPVT